MKHCGACKKEFKTAKELIKHLKICVLAKVGEKLMQKWNKESLEDE